MLKTDPPEQKKNFKDCFIIYAEEETEIHYMVENQLQVVHGRKSSSGMMRSLLADYWKTKHFWFKTQKSKPDSRKNREGFGLHENPKSSWKELPEIFCTNFHKSEENCSDVIRRLSSLLDGSWLHRSEWGLRQASTLIFNERWTFLSISFKNL